MYQNSDKKRLPDRRDRLMIKIRKRLIKNYYKKPNLFKIIITRAAVVFLILAAMILMITVRSYEIFLENERLFSDSPRTNFYENSLKNAFELCRR